MNSRNFLFALCTILMVAVFVVSCGGSAPEPSSVAPVTSAASQPEKPVAETPEPTKTPEPAPTATSIPTPVPQPTPTPTPVPTATPVPPPTPTPTPMPTPTPTPVILFDEHNFVLDAAILDGITASAITKSGWAKDDADDNQGIITFEYGGVNILLYWDSWTSTTEELLADSYANLRIGNPDLNINATSEGTDVIDDSTVNYAAYSYTQTDNSTAGGIIGSWLCGTERGFNLITSGADATTTQLRFDRILAAFKCKGD